MLLEAIVEALHGVTTPRFFRSERDIRVASTAPYRKPLTAVGS